MDLIVTTPEKLKEIIIDCLNEQSNTPLSNDKAHEPKMLHSIKELANFLNCSVVTAQKLKNSRKIRYHQYGRKVVFNTQHILEDLNKKKNLSNPIIFHDTISYTNPHFLA